MSEDATPAPNETEQRIAALLAKTDAATSQAESTAAQNLLLVQRLANLEGTIAKITQSQPTPVPLKAALGNPEPSMDVAALVRGIVQEAIQPIVDAHRETKEEKAQSAKHAVAFAAAARQYPDLNDQNSNLYKVASQLWDGRPDIVKLSDAPLLIASLAHSALGTQKQIEQKQTEVKRQAGINRPAPVSQKIDLGSSETAQAIAGARDTADAGIESGAGPRTFTNLFRAALTEAAKGTD